MNRKILVLGNGFVGKPLALALDADTTPKRLHELTIEDVGKYDVVINTAAKTSIDWCEEHKEETFMTNVIHAIHVATICKAAGVKHIFFSSGCIFKTDETLNVNFEDSIPNPQCFYTYTKLMAEQLLSEVSPETIIIRPRLLISEKSHPRNTIDKLLKYDKIINTEESATILEDLIDRIKAWVESPELDDMKGPYNLFNEGTVTPSQIATLWKHPHTIITKAELDEITKGKARRVSTILDTSRTTPLPRLKARLREIVHGWFMDRDKEFNY